MAHERDDNKYDGQEDGEYHFSDDQGGYEEPEIVPTKAAPVTASPVAAMPLKARISQYRKPLMGFGVFVLLIFLVYKISAPTTSTTPNTDFAQNAGTIPVQKPVMKQMPKPIKVAQTPAPQSAEFQPLPEAPGMSTATPTAAPAAAPAATPPVTTSLPETAAAAMPPPPVAETVATVTPSMPAPAAPAPAESYYNPQHPNANLFPADKLTVLEQENAKLAAQYTQKLAEEQAQNAALQNQIQDLTQRLASMESTLAHLGRVIQDLKPSRGGPMAAGALEQTSQSMPLTTAPSGEPKSSYSVQAIIPGRAWLKSDNGETVTVAEGDILKNYGRIMKIDPYDGIVQIDTGSRMINLAYGVSAD